MEHYGNGKSSGLEQTVSESIQTGFTVADLELHPERKGSPETTRRTGGGAGGLADHAGETGAVAET